MKRRIVRSVAATVVVVVGMSLAACTGAGPASSGGKGAEAVDAALKKGGEITFWSWSPTAKKQVAAFEKAYPQVKVNLVNSGGAADSNLKLQNALTAGNGAPDVAQMEYMSVPQFVLGKGLLDLTDYGFGELERL